METALPGRRSFRILVTDARNSMLDVLNKDYVKTARAKGLPE